MTAAVLLVAMAGLALFPLPGTGLPYLIDCGALWAALALDRSRPLATARYGALASLTFGIYLVHPFFLASVARLLHGTGLGGNLLAFLLSAGTAWLLRHALGRPGRRIS